MEENFDRLQKLLTLKRYEVPPPGFFNHFSDKIIARIEAGEASRSLRWWEKLGLDFDLKPALVCGLGVVICGLLSAGLITSVFQDNDQPLANSVTLSPSINMPAGAFVSGRGDELSSSTQPVFSASRFDHFGGRVQRTSFFNTSQ
jgi:hypothetical protein